VGERGLLGVFTVRRLPEGAGGDAGRVSGARRSYETSALETGEMAQCMAGRMRD
jgi:hypothetical protein